MKKTQLSVLVVALAATATLLTGCGNQKIGSESRVASGPTSQENVGLIVSKNSERNGFLTQNSLESQLAKAAQTDARLKVRVINSEHGVFEAYGVSQQELEQLLNDSSVTIQRNQFVRFQSVDLPKVMTSTQLLAAGVITEAEAESFVKPCTNNPLTRPKLRLKANGKRDVTDQGFLLKLGDAITIDSTLSTTAAGGKDLQVMFVMYPNADSQLTPVFSVGSSFSFKPDTYGEFTFIVVAKDAQNSCAISKDIVYTTDSGIPYDAKRAMPPEAVAKVDLTRFWQLTSTDAQASWALSTGENVVVAIIDSGVNYNHPALAANIYVNKKEVPGNGKDDDGNGFIDDVAGYDFGNSDGYPFDDYGHGTHCAGITASPVFGLAKGAKIMPIKVGTGPGIDVASVAGGIYYAVDNGAKVLSLSLGFELDAPALRAAIAYANTKNVVVIAAAGNGDSEGKGMNNDLVPMFPASYNFPNVISVAATSVTNQITEYSNYGLKSVDVGAPGGDQAGLVLSTYKDNPRNSPLTGMAGTSMATPAVAGVAAQVIAKKPGITPQNLRLLLMTTGKDVVSLKGKTVSGKMVNSLSALKN